MDGHSHGHALLILPHALLLVLLAPAGADALPSLTDSLPAVYLAAIRRSFSSAFHCLLSPLLSRSLRLLAFVGMVKVAALCGFIPAVWLWRRQRRAASSGSLNDAADSNGADAVSTDPGLLKKHSAVRSYTVRGPNSNFTYPAIRTFYRPHSQADKLPQTPRPVPLLVFIHGLGGSVAQFHPLLVSLINLAPCLSIDLPGCGVSEFSPTAWDAYSTDSLVRLLAVVIESYRDRENDQGVVLIGHSMGCSLAALLASSSSPYADLISEHVVGLVAVCPKATPPSSDQVKSLKMLLAIPTPIFNVMRWWDRRGGTESNSVTRFVGPDAEEEAKKLQVRFNMQSKTPVWRRMARGTLPDYSSGTAQGGLPGKETWSGLEIPVFLAAGEADHVTPASELKAIVSFLGKDVPKDSQPPRSEVVPDSAAPVDSTAKTPFHRETKQDSGVDASDLPGLTASSTLSSRGESDTNFEESNTLSSISKAHIPEPLPRKLVLKTTVLPHPASHALLYAPNTSRTLAGLIGNFLSTHVDARLSLGWQLQYLTTEGKWDVKNLAKWQAVKPVSEPIGGIFRAMKTLREVDEKHCPKVFVDEWKGKIKAVVDISHESPVYDPAGLEAGGIMYCKFPTVSKLPPTVDEVNAFIALIDRLRFDPATAGAEAAAAEAQATSHSTPLSTATVSANSKAPLTVEVAEANATPLSSSSSSAAVSPTSQSHPVAAPTTTSVSTGKQGLIGVHCHYGFNRTGFFLVCYLVERLGYSLPAAIREFETKRPPGIRHEHFKDALYVRYCIGLKRAPTL